MTAPNPICHPCGMGFELADLIDRAWRNAPCPKCGRVKACRCLLGDEELRKYRARAVVAALADAGQLLPPDTDTRTQWAVRLGSVGDGDITIPATSEQDAHDHAKAYNDGAGGDPRIVGAVIRERVIPEVVATYPPVPTTGETL